MIPEVNPYNNYRGDGLATRFDYDFLIENSSQLIVEKINENDEAVELVNGVDYEIKEIGNNNGGYIVFPIATSEHKVLAKNETISLQLTLPVEQVSEYGQSSLLNLGSLEFSLDYLTRLIQILKRKIERSVKAYEGNDIIDITLPPPKANNTFAWNEDCSALVNYDIIGENNAFKNEMVKEFQSARDEFNTTIATNKQEILDIQDDYEQENNAKFVAFQDELNTKFETVADAADRINDLDSDLAIATNAAEQATQEAQNAAQQVQNAKEQAEIATSKAEEILNVKDELEAEIENKADVDLSNLSEIGMKKIGGGGGLEVGFIGFTQGYIDETKNLQRYLTKVDNYIIQDQFEAFTQWLKKSAELSPDMVCTNEEYEAELALSPNNVCQKYVIDDKAGTIRLPKYPDYLDLTINAGAVSQTVSVYGNGKAMGLTNNDETGGLGSDSNGVLKVYSTNYGNNVGTSVGTDLIKNKVIGLVKDASKSGITGKVTVPAVQSEKIKGAYFIQLATGASESIDTTRATEINNPFFFGQSQYFEATPNNPSWVKSTGTYLSKAVYPDYYDWLLRIFNGTETQEGVSVKEAGASDITDYDFVINQTDETFRLPLLNGSETMPSDKFVDLAIKATNSPYIAPANGYVKFQYRTDAAGSVIILRSANIDNAQTSGVANQLLRVTIKVNKGQEYIAEYTSTSSNSSLNKLRFTYSQGNGDLYYYIGEGIVNPQLVNVARIEEVKANKTDVDGQWIGANQYSLIASTTLTTTPVVMDLSDILPNDGYKYLLSLSMTVKGANAAASNVYGETSELEKSSVRFTVRDIGNNIMLGNAGYAVVGADRKLYARTSSSSNTTGLSLLGYKRLGTNQ